MSIQWFEQLYDTDSKDLPWVKDFIRDGGNPNEAYHVHEVHIGNRGALILTSDWKGFLFKGSQSYNHLVEALEFWIQSIDPCSELVAGSSRDGKPKLGIDDSKPIFYWEKIDDSYYQKSNGGDTTIQTTKPSNPLLASATIPSNGRINTSSPSIPPKRAKKSSGSPLESPGRGVNDE